MQPVASEKQMFLQSFQRESDTTLKILKAYPAERADYKPHEKSRSARELAWTFVIEQGLAAGALSGHVDFSQPMPKPPADYKDVLAAFERGCRDTMAKVSAASDEDLGRTMQFPVAPKQKFNFWDEVYKAVKCGAKFPITLEDARDNMRIIDLARKGTGF